jgi:hypothetical protein
MRNYTNRNEIFRTGLRVITTKGINECKMRRSCHSAGSISETSEQIWIKFSIGDLH